ncbi:hypothetical protein N7457_007081 [Penicillium paradoxum]|uniref:uncharacterized protein n=1 Tax=Penicillium paradoxum TaxID=176176 RepID=UPI002547218F|nr:uncharacterized protein N7457_007081 [Penicillium paradoxum]KAJ5779361.1 hypothetical protein N7457_007081 [Penicillium paradoxum]
MLDRQGQPANHILAFNKPAIAKDVTLPKGGSSSRQTIFPKRTASGLVSGCEVAMSGRPSLHHSSRSETDPSVSQSEETNLSPHDAAALKSREVSPSTPLETKGFGTYGSASRIVSDQPLNAKVAIPRLDLPLANSSGREANVLCLYVDGKRERNAKFVTLLDPQLKYYESLVRDIYPKFDTELARVVDQALEKISSLSLSSPTVAKTPDDTDLSTPTNPFLDHTLEDFNGDSSLQVIGFVGEHSATVWLYRLKLLINQTAPSTDGQSEQSAHPSLSSCGLFMDELVIPSTNDPDVFACPPQPIADELVDRYFQVAHASFPIIGKEIFLSQCRSFYSNMTTHPGNKWMALLNMVFAIAARHSELASDGPQPDRNNHAIYFSRAWRLIMSENVLLDHPNLQQTQVEALVSLYMLSIGQANRAWRLCGIAIQSAIAMGIHLRSESTTITYVSKETRYRLWWALYLLDTVLCVMTGRMPRMQQEHCTTPLPVPYKEEDFRDEHVMKLILDNQYRGRLIASLPSCDPSFSNENLGQSPSQQTMPQALPPPQIQANGSLYLLYSINLAAVMRDAINLLYSPEAGRKTQNDTELAITSLNNAADNWFARLPETYRFIEPRIDRAFARQRTSLAFQYYSTKLVILHPTLHALARGEDNISDLYTQMATICVKSASQMLDLLPDEPNISWLLGCSPWWCALHYLTQSTVVLSTQLFTQSRQPRPGERNETLERVQKALRWLGECSIKDGSFHRAWGNFTELLSQRCGLR